MAHNAHATAKTAKTIHGDNYSLISIERRAGEACAFYANPADPMNA